MTETLFTDTNYRAWALLNQTRHAIYQIVGKELRSLGISPAQGAMLLVIKSINPSPSLGQIGRLLIREHNSVSVLLNKMLRQGLVSKMKDPDRKNVTRVALTDKGRKVCKLVMSSETIPRIFSCLSEKESQQLISNLDKLLDQAHKELGIERRLPFV